MVYIFIPYLVKRNHCNVTNFVFMLNYLINKSSIIISVHHITEAAQKTGYWKRERKEQEQSSPELPPRGNGLFWGSERYRFVL